MTQRRPKIVDYEENHENPLCLCEYFDRNNQRKHLLMCLCNCDAFDRLCTSCLCCNDDTEENDFDGSIQSINKNKKNQIKNFFFSKKYLLMETLTDISDRCRVPFPGGARKINWDFVTTFSSIYVYITLGTVNFLFSLMTIFMIPFLLYLRFFTLRLSSSKRSSNLNTVTSTNVNETNSLTENPTNKKYDDLKSLNKSQNPRIQLAFFMILNAFFFVIFYFNLSLYDELSDIMSLQEKYFFNLMIIVAVILHVYLRSSNPGFIISYSKPKGEALISNRPASDENYCDKCNINRGMNVGHCPVCMKCSFNRDHHCFWVDNCISYLNQKTFLFYLFYLQIFFCYSLRVIFLKLNSLECTLTNFWWSNRKINDNSSFSCLFDVYYSNFNRALLTLLFIQLIPLISYLTLLLIQQFFFISLGVTQYQLFKISQKNYRFSLAVFIVEHFSFKKSITNWFLFLSKYRKMSDICSKQSFDHLV